MRTFMPKADEIERKWYIIDAANQPLGRVATEAATLLRGKHKEIYTPNMDCGDFVIVINAEKVALTGRKLDQKQYIRHSRFPGGLKTMSYRELLKRQPEKAIEKAVRGMLPHNVLGRQMGRKLKVYAGEAHKNDAQQPEVWTIRG